MSRLSIYLSRQYLASALSLFGAVAFLVWINQTLKLFDLVTAKGQSLLTLIGQSLLTTPPLSRAMLYICIGIGIARTLNALQVSRELHTIHATRRIGALWSSLFVTATVSALAVGLLAHWIEPAGAKGLRRVDRSRSPPISSAARSNRTASARSPPASSFRSATACPTARSPISSPTTSAIRLAPDL